MHADSPVARSTSATCSRAAQGGGTCGERRGTPAAAVMLRVCQVRGWQPPAAPTWATGTAQRTTVSASATSGMTGRTTSTWQGWGRGMEVGHLLCAAAGRRNTGQRRLICPCLPSTARPTCFLKHSLAASPSTVGRRTSCAVDLNSACAEGAGSVRAGAGGAGAPAAAEV